MNQNDKKLIRQWLHKIWVEDMYNDSQAEDINEFLSLMAGLSDFDYMQAVAEVRGEQ